MLRTGLTDTTYEIYLNSEFDKQFNDTVSNWTTEFTSIGLNPNKGYQLALSSAQVPNTCPQFSEFEKHFKFTDGTTTYSVSYDNSKIFNNVSDMLLYVSGLFSSRISGVVVSQDADSKKTKITNNSGDDLVLIFNDESSKSFYRKLGFEYDGNTTVLTAQNIISSCYPSILGTSRFYIVCEEIVNNSYSGKNYKNWSIFKSINLNVGFGSYCNFQSNNELYYHDLNVGSSINNLSFRILDDQFRQIDLNGGGVMMSLFLREI